MIKAAWWRKGFHFILQLRVHCEWNRGGGRSEDHGETLTTNPSLCLAPFFLYMTQDHLPKDGATHSALGPHISTTNLENEGNMRISSSQRTLTCVKLTQKRTRTLYMPCTCFPVRVQSISPAETLGSTVAAPFVQAEACSCQESSPRIKFFIQSVPAN